MSEASSYCPSCQRATGLGFCQGSTRNVVHLWQASAEKDMPCNTVPFAQAPQGVSEFQFWVSEKNCRSQWLQVSIMFNPSFSERWHFYACWIWLSHICLRSYQRCEIGHEASRHSAGHVSTNKTKQRFCMQGAHGNSNKAIGMDQRCPLLGGKRSNWVTSNSIQIHVRCLTCWSSATAKWDEGCMSLKKGNHAQGRLKWKIDFPCHTLYCTWYVFYPSKGKVWKDNRIRADFQIVGTVMHENSSDRIETTQRKKLMMILSKLMTSYGIAIKLTKNREPQVHSYWFSGRILLDPRAYPYVFFFSVTSWQMDEHPSAHPYGGDVSRQNSKVGDVFPGFVFHPGVFSVLFRWAY